MTRKSDCRFWGAHAAAGTHQSTSQRELSEPHSERAESVLLAAEEDTPAVYSPEQPATRTYRSQNYGRGRGVGRGLGVGVILGATVGVGVAVGVAVALGVGLEVGVGVAATGTMA
jgi:hypothetical protein